jgi:hypothetical protein
LRAHCRHGAGGEAAHLSQPVRLLIHGADDHWRGGATGYQLATKVR